jgi:hypothetical protein
MHFGIFAHDHFNHQQITIMNKLLRSLAVLLLSVPAFAQLPNGSSAPDFTATDIQGNTHNLSTYLAEGKTVILDISATWCAPCWNYHNSKALDDFYTAYGPEGSNEVVVLFVEGDASTTLADLNGAGNNTQGDWVSGSNYPIIDNASIANLYQITYFPTVYRICPTGIVTEVGAASASSLRNGVNSSCGTLAGVSNHVKADALDLRLCTAGTNNVQVKMKNYGTNNVTSGVLELKENGETVATKNFTGNLTPFGTTNQTFQNVTINEGSTYTYDIASVNGATPYEPAIAEKDLNIAVAGHASTNVQVVVHTDNYPSEISWKIYNSANTQVASGGPYQPGNEDQYGGGGPDANTAISQDVTLDANDCYRVVLSDGFGDGWGEGSGQHGLEILDQGAPVFQQFIGNFGTTLTIPAALNTTMLANTQFDSSDFAVYPNPSTGVFSIHTIDTASVSVFDVTGKQVYSSENVSDNGTINLSALQKGIYIAKFRTASAEHVEKLIIQ